MRRACLYLVGVLCLAPVPAAAQAAAARDLDGFLREAGPICARQPAAECIDLGWQVADADRDGRLSLGEVQAVRSLLQDWFARHGAALPMRDRSLLAISLGLIDATGVQPLMDGFDTDGDGGVSRAELLADVRLDSRPLGDILIDPDAVDRAALADRLGVLAPLTRLLQTGRS